MTERLEDVVNDETMHVKRTTKDSLASPNHGSTPLGSEYKKQKLATESTISDCDSDDSDSLARVYAFIANIEKGRIIRKQKYKAEKERADKMLENKLRKADRELRAKRDARAVSFQAICLPAQKVPKTEGAQGIKVGIEYHNAHNKA